jgi:sulfur-oxidizing protein SoxA
MSAAAWPFESQEQLSMSAYLGQLSRGTPKDADINGPAAATFRAGKALFEKKIGRLEQSCAQCHNDYYGQKFGSEQLSQGHPTDHPVYKISESRIISLHERMRQCNRLVRAEPMPSGSDDYVALELYLAWRSKNLLIDAPGVRP